MSLYRSLSRPLAALVLALAPLSAQTVIIQPTKAEKATETRTVPLATGSTLEVHNLNGHIRAEAWDRAEVQFTGDFKPSSEGEQVKVVLEPSSGGLEIRGEYPKHDGHGSYRGPQCQMTLKVPRQVRPLVDTVNGEITLIGTQGAAALTTVNGAVHASGLGDALKAHTVNGSIILDRVSGALDLGTVNGGIQASGLAGTRGGIKAETVNGAIRLQLTGIQGRLKASTLNGSISFKSQGAEQVDVKKHRVSAVFPGSDQAIELGTVNGSITLE
jgi:DUF4097 and DUF4098 domain-containing protein YvlB